MPICGVCGSKDFFVESGFYYCSLCQSQLEDAREELNENNLDADSSNLHEQTLRKTRKHSSGLSKTDELVSWEVYNFLLRGFVDEMIFLGATKDLKIIVLQLWTSYLSRLEIAFHGKSSINFGLTYIKRDVELLLGVNFNKISPKHRILKVKKNKRKKKKKKEQNRKSLETDLEDSESERHATRYEKRKLTMLKRKLLDVENSQLKNEEDKSFIETNLLQSQSQTLENLTQNERKDEASLHSKFKLSKHSKTIMDMFEAKTSDLDSSKRNQMLKNLMHNHSRSGCHMTMAKLFGLLQLGMMFSEQDAQISDTLRWITEGHITHEKYKSFLPEETSVNGTTINAFLNLKLTNSGIRSSIKKIANVLSITSLPIPDFSKLTARYCQELQLPGELLELVHKLLVLCPPKSSFSDRYSFEARAMSYIIIALKLVFGLDGVTERTFSNVADLINRKCNKGKTMKLFSWVEWVKFIECRKAVIAHFHYPTRLSVCKERSIDSDVTAFFNYWQKRNLYDDHSESTSKGINDQVKLILDELAPTSSSSCVVNFPGSLTPLLTYSKELLEHHSHLLQPSVCKILKKQFTSQRLLLPSRCKIYEKDGIKINIQPSCLRELEKVPFIKLPCIPTVFRNAIIQTVIVENKPKKKIVKLEPATSEKRKRSYSDDDLTEITNNLLKKRLIEVEEGKLKDLKIDNCNGSDIEFSGQSFVLSEPYKHYWLLHGDFYDHHKCTVEQFDEISRKQFSSSFLWLLKECSRVINDFPRTLYIEVVSTEAMLMDV